MIEITPEYLASQGLSETFQKRFWSKVKKTESCWLWIGAKNQWGYGRINSGHGILIASHRAAWIITFGPIPVGQCVLHKCDNPTCVNPNHIFVGTPKDNTNDMISKGRMAVAPNYGPSNGNSKLSYEIADEIRQIYKTGKRSQRLLALDYGVTQKAIFLCLKMKTWIRH